MQWKDIENAMHTLEDPTAGFSAAHRGIITLPNGAKVFVKVVGDEEIKQWIQKEIAVYQMLEAKGYQHIPKLLAHNDDLTGFALEALTKDNGWDWSDNWDDARLGSTFAAMDGLAVLTLSHEEKAKLGPKGITKEADGWQKLCESDKKQAVLHQKLVAIGRKDISESLDVTALAKQSASYPFRDDALVHHDVRADNCAWCPQEQTVKFIDWEWTQLGDRTMDQNAVLAHVFKSTRFDVLARYQGLLNADALHWLAGFWLNASTNPLFPSAHDKRVRDYQLASGIAALDLAAKVS